MKEQLTLKENQSVNHEIMKDIHAFCVLNGIHYSLAYGSLLGAIRHKGFIPWDDDIDIMMPRPDFELFSKTYKSSKGFELCSVYSDETFVNYTRVYDSQTVVISPAKQARRPVGIWVDVFPIDAIPDSLSDQKRQFDRLRHYTYLIMRYRVALRNLEVESLNKRLRGCLQMTKLFLENGSVSFSKWHNQVITISKENTFGKTRCCSSLVCVEANTYNKQEVFLTSDFDSYILMPFESESFFIVDSYNSVLTTIFGDYMQLPPEEKRVSHILKRWSFFRR